MRDDDIVYTTVTQKLEQALPEVYLQVKNLQDIFTGFTAEKEDLESFTQKFFTHRASNENLYLDFPALADIYSQFNVLLLSSDPSSLRYFIKTNASSCVNQLLVDDMKVYIRADSSTKEEGAVVSQIFRKETSFKQEHDLSPWLKLPFDSRRNWSREMKKLGSSPLRALRIPVERYYHTPFRFFTEEMALQRYADHRAAIGQHEHNIARFFDFLRKEDATVPQFNVHQVSEQLMYFQQVHESIHADEKHFDTLHEKYYQLTQSVAYVITDNLLKKNPQMSLGMNKHLFTCNCGHTHSDPQDSVIPMFYNYPARMDTVVIDAWNVVTFAMDSLEDLKEVGRDFLEKLLEGDGDFFVNQGFAWYTEEINARISAGDMSHFEQMMQ